MTAVIPRIRREYVPAQPLFPPWVTTAGILVLFGVCVALGVLFLVGIINILIALSQEGLA